MERGNSDGVYGKALRRGMRGCGDAGMRGCGTTAVIPSERSESRDLHLRIAVQGIFTRSTRRRGERLTRRTALRAEHFAPARLLSIHAFESVWWCGGELFLAARSRSGVFRAIGGRDPYAVVETAPERRSVPRPFGSRSRTHPLTHSRAHALTRSRTHALTNAHPPRRRGRASACRAGGWPARRW